MRSIVAVPALAALAIVGSPAIAQADYSDCSNGLEMAYSRHYAKVAKVHGKRAPGRNIRKWGKRYWLKPSRQWRIRDARCSELRRSNSQLKALLVAPNSMRSQAVPPSQQPSGVESDRDVANLPDCTWRPESGGDYGAVNPTSGAFGKYQIIPSTWAAHCSDLSHSPTGQEECAVRVYEAQGSGAWVNC